MLSDWAVVIYFVTIANIYIEPPEAAHARIDDDRSDEVIYGALPASPNWTSHISYDVVASLLRMLSDWAVVIYFVTIATNYIEPPEAAHARIDDDR